MAIQQTIYNIKCSYNFLSQSVEFLKFLHANLLTLNASPAWKNDPIPLKDSVFWHNFLLINRYPSILFKFGFTHVIFSFLPHAPVMRYNLAKV